MLTKNRPERFSAVTKSFHWVMAILILVMLPVGFFMTEMELSPAKLEFYGLHKSIGILILILAAGRLGWRFLNPPPESLPTHATWEKKLAQASHFLMYAAIFLMPLVGWAMSSAGDFRNSFFGLFEMPDIAPKNEDLFEFLRDAHTVLAVIIIFTVGLHILGALKHHVIDRDATLQRMTSHKMGLVPGLLLAGVAGFLLLSALVFWVNDDFAEAASEENALSVESAAVDISEDLADAAEDAAKASGITEWDVDKKQSAIKFSVDQSGAAFEGLFNDWDAEIYFDPERLEQSYVYVEIDLTSISTGSKDRDVQAQDPEWLDTQTHPKAVFRSYQFIDPGPQFTVPEGKIYEMEGDLTIRGVTVPILVSFALNIIQNPESGQRTARVKAGAHINRQDFSIGQGPYWETEQNVGFLVPVDIQLVAESE